MISPYSSVITRLEPGVELGLAEPQRGAGPHHRVVFYIRSYGVVRRLAKNTDLPLGL